MNTSELIPQEHIIFTEFDGGDGVLVDLDTKRYYHLNETAILVWRGLEQGKSADEIAADIVAEYEVTSGQAGESVRRLLSSLQTYKLIRPR